MSAYFDPFAPVLTPVTVPVPCPAADSLEHTTLDPTAALDSSCPAVVEPQVAHAEIYTVDPDIVLPTDVSTDPDIYLRRFADPEDVPSADDVGVPRGAKLLPRDRYRSAYRYYLARRRAGEDSLQLALDTFKPPQPVDLSAALLRVFALTDSGRPDAAEDLFNAYYEILTLRLQHEETMATLVQIRDELLGTREHYHDPSGAR